MTTAQNFTNLATASDTYKSIADTLKDLQFYGNAGLAVAGAIEKDNFLGWLEGLDGVLNTWQVHDEKKEEIERETLRRQKAEEYQWSIEGTRVTPDKQVYFVDEEGNIYLPVVEEREEEDAQSQLSQDNADGSEEEYELSLIHI